MSKFHRTNFMRIAHYQRGTEYLISGGENGELILAKSKGGNQHVLHYDTFSSPIGFLSALQP